MDRVFLMNEKNGINDIISAHYKYRNKNRQVGLTTRGQLAIMLYREDLILRGD